MQTPSSAPQKRSWKPRYSRGVVWRVPAKVSARARACQTGLLWRELIPCPLRPPPPTPYCDCLFSSGSSVCLAKLQFLTQTFHRPNYRAPRNKWLGWRVKGYYHLQVKLRGQHPPPKGHTDRHTVAWGPCLQSLGGLEDLRGRGGGVGGCYQL